jgi:GNAT superfamily N-acetyltransferase
MTDASATDTVVVIRAAKPADIDAVEPLWIALYKHQKEHGMLLDLSASSFGQWAETMKPALGRFTCLFVAERNGDMIGFLAGTLKTLPPYFGGHLIGFVSEVFVADAHRGRRVGRDLIAAALQWFKAQRAHRVELQVVMNNSGARKLYNKLGWGEELVQMVWQWPVM